MILDQDNLCPQAFSYRFILSYRLTMDTEQHLPLFHFPFSPNLFP